MLSREMMHLLSQVIGSWQVLTVTIVLVIYIFLVNYVARSYHRPRVAAKFKLPTIKKPKKANPTEEIETTDDNDELGLEEE